MQTRKALLLSIDSHLSEKNASRALFRIIVLDISVERCGRIRIFLRERFADLCSVTERKVKVVRPARMSGYDLDRRVPCAKSLFQLFKGAHRQLIVLRQRADEAAAAVCAEPDRIAGEQVFVVDEIDHVSPGVPGNEKTFRF